MFWPFENNNRKTIKKLACKSLQAGGARNLLTILTIGLSAALLSGFLLSIAGMKTAERNNLRVSVHAQYRDIDSRQTEQLEKDARISDTLLMKQAPSTRIDNYLVIPVYLEQKESNIATDELVEGRYPRALYEAAVDKAFLERLGLPVTLGTPVTITFYDGTTEEFTITGLTDNGSTERAYTLYCSRQYAEEGSQLKNAITAVAVQLKDAGKMSEEQFKETVIQIGADYGISRRNSDVSEQFAHSLSPSSDEGLMIFIVSLTLLVISCLIIYSIFYIYVQNQVREFGQLRTIGTTSGQIRKMIRFQGKILCLAGTAAGLPIGYLVAYLFRPEGWSWSQTGLATLAVFLFSHAVILFSLGRPARMAGKIPPIEASRSTGCEGIIIRKSSKLHRKISPFTLSVISSGRNRKKLIATVLSLSASGIMFLAGTTLITSLDMERFARSDLLEYGEFKFYLSRNAIRNDPLGQTGVQLHNPLDEAFMQKVADIEGVEGITQLKNLEVRYTYHDYQERNKLGLYTSENEELLKQYLLQGSFDYESMSKKNQVLLLRNQYSQLIHDWQFQVGDYVTLRWFDGSQYQEEEFQIAGEISDGIFKDPAGGLLFGKTQYFLLTDKMLARMMPGVNLNSHLVVSIAENADEPAIRARMNGLIAENPYITMDSLYDYYLDSRAMYQRTVSVIWGISLFFTLFAVLNLINTLLANTLSQKHEYALMRAVGMGKRQLRRTIQCEGIILAFWNILITLTLGTGTGFAIVRYLNNCGDDTWVWTFPLLYFVGYAVYALLLPFLIATVLDRIVQKKSLVEQLREV